MALVFMDGFDHYATDDILKKWDYEGGYIWGSNAIQASLHRRYATKYLWLYDHWVEKDIVDTVTGSDIYTFVVGAALYYQTSAEPVSIQLLNAYRHCQIRITTSTSGKVQIYRGYNSLIEETDPAYVSPNTWYHIEAKVFVDESSGSYEVKLNEVTVLSGSGVNTHANPTEGGVTKVRIGGGQYAGGGAGIDDFYLLDGNASDDPSYPNNDFLGDCRIDVIYPDAPGTYTDFTPSDGANYENVDDGSFSYNGGDIDDDDTYNQSNNVGDKDCYNLDSVQVLGTPIYAAAQNTCARKTDAGKRYVTQFVRINSTNYFRDTGLTLDDGEWHLTDNYKVIQRPMDTNPDTDLAWTEANLNAVESGIEITT